MTFGYEFFIIFVMFLNIDQYREVSIQFVLPFIFIVVIDNMRAGLLLRFIGLGRSGITSHDVCQETLVLNFLPPGYASSKHDEGNAGSRQQQ
ncbi:hypothetical protein ACJX0J_030081, partial [Zea mays]